jgi:hypothetical protein
MAMQNHILTFPSPAIKVDLPAPTIMMKANQALQFSDLNNGAQLLLTI